MRKLMPGELPTGDECAREAVRLIGTRDFLEAQVWATLAHAQYTAMARWGRPPQ